MAKVLGEKCQTSVAADIHHLSGEYMDIKKLTDTKIEAYLSARVPAVVNFVRGVAGKQRPYPQAKAVESMYFGKSKNCVLPLSFAENIVSYSVGLSEFVTNINGKQVISPRSEIGFQSRHPKNSTR